MLCSNTQFAKSLGAGANKVRADKKMLQKMRRIGEYFDANCPDGNNKEAAFQHLRNLIQASPKSKETLTGIDKLIAEENKQKNSPS